MTGTRYPTPGERLEPGTPVIRRHPVGKPRYGDLDPRHRGVVALYQLDLPTSLGTFPVKWRNGLTTICGADDVIVIEAVETANEVDAA